MVGAGVARRGARGHDAHARGGVLGLVAVVDRAVHPARAGVSIRAVLADVSAAREIRRAVPGVGILMLTMLEDDESVRSAITAGAAGYVLKGDAQDPHRARDPRVRLR